MKKIIASLVLLHLAAASFAYKLSPVCQNQKIVIYTKRSCIYCIKLKQTFEQAKISFTEIEITNNDLLRNWLISSTQAYTVPYVFLGDKYIGGYTDFMKKCITRKNSDE